MNILFVHHNFPAQFRNLAADLALASAHRLVAIGSQTARDMDGVQLERYAFTPSVGAGTHPFARRFDLDCRRSEQVLYAATDLRASGFVPDLCLVHCGWGENLPIRAVFPTVKMVTYCEFYYRAEGQDVDFDPENPALGVDGAVALHAKNAATLLSLAESDLGLSPTAWQRSTYPESLQAKIMVGHEGVDVDRVKPDPAATLVLPSGRTLTAADQVITYVARDLEPLRGFRSFMRALPLIQAAHPRAQCVIIGGDSVSYGAEPAAGGSWKASLLQELAGRLDESRLHFLGRVPFEVYLSALRISTVHVYLSYPFVLSWSVLEAMAAGCLVVGSDTAPVREVLDAETGIIVPFFDTGRLVAEVGAVLSNPPAYAARRARARDFVRSRYETKLCVERVKALIGLS